MSKVLEKTKGIQYTSIAIGTVAVAMIATPSEEMTSTINEVAKNTESTRTIADTAVSQAKTASDKIAERGTAAQEIAGNVAQASQGLTEINESVVQGSRVSDGITTDISEVSRQSMEMTNSSSTVNLNAGELLTLAEKLKEMVGTFKV